MYGLHFLAQEIFTLALVHGQLRRVAYFLFNADYIELFIENLNQHAHAAAGRELLKEFLLILNLHAHVLRDVVRHEGRSGIGKHI